MLIYRFRITNDTIDGFLREIEIHPNHTFLDFHHAILESVDIHICEQASFFITDKKFKREKEITLKNEKRKERKYDEDLDIVVTETVVYPLMKASKIKSFIEDPHQRMIYEMNGKVHHLFHIELYRIYRSEEMVSLPRCIRQSGELPKPVEPTVPVQTAPVSPRTSPVHKPMRDIVALEKFNDLVEDEQELKAIENNLEEILEADIPAAEPEETVNISEEPYTYEGQHTEAAHDEEEEVQMDHLEDYDDIESLDRRLSGYDRDSDDFA